MPTRLTNMDQITVEEWAFLDWATAFGGAQRSWWLPAQMFANARISVSKLVKLGFLSCGGIRYHGRAYRVTKFGRQQISTIPL